MDLRTFHRFGVAMGRHRRARASAAARVRTTEVAEVAPGLSGSSMRVMEAGLAAVAIATAILIGVGR